MTTPFIKTNAAEIVQYAMDLAPKLSFAVSITGKAGMGKSSALKHYCVQNDYIYFEIGQGANSSPTGFYKELYHAYGWSPEGSSCAEMSRLFQKYVEPWNPSERPKLLVVDEFQTLSPMLQRELLFLNEHAEIPLVVCGNRERLAKGTKDKNALEQINSRMGAVFNVGFPTDEDCDKFGNAYGLEGMEAYRALRTFGSSRSLRAIGQFLEIATTMQGPKKTLQIHNLETTARMMFGDCEVLRTESRQRRSA